MMRLGELDLELLLGCLCVWLVLYFSLLYLLPVRGAEWHCRTITVIHAVFISFMAGWCCFVEGPWPLTDAGGPNTPSQVITATICLAYFIFDFSWCLYYQTEGFTMLLHHFLSILGLAVTLLIGRYGTELVATICGGEVTNPLLQLRWFLRETGHKDTLAAEIVDWLFVCSFGFMRLGVGTILLYCYFTQPTTDYLGRFGAICIYSLGVVFWINIMQFAKKKYSGRKRKTMPLGEGDKNNKCKPVTGRNIESLVNSADIIPSQGELKKLNACLNLDNVRHVHRRMGNGVIPVNGDTL